METSGNFQVSELINVGTFIDQWDDTARLSCQKLVDGSNEKYALARQMGITQETVDELTDVCSVDALLTGKEPPKNILYKEIPSDLDLYSVRFQKYELELRKEFSYRQMVARNMKYSLSENIKCLDHKDDMKTQIETPLPNPNVVLNICIHRPYMPRPHTKLKQDDTFLVLATQKLTELRDAITCVSDLTTAGEYSDNPDFTAVNNAKELFKSGFFFFEGIFYDDMRDPLNRRYSKEIIEWDNDSSHGNNAYTAKNMEDTSFSDLTIHLGQPYLYMHQGNCEHIVIISDIRVLHSSDPQDLKSYPFKVLNKRARRTICRACMMSTAKWMVENSHLTPNSPCFLCNACFKMLLYDKNNKKIGNFEARKYFDTSVK